MFIYTMQYSHSHQKVDVKVNLTIYKEVDGNRGYYAEWHKSIRERQLHDFTHMEFKKQKRQS